MSNGITGELRVITRDVSTALLIPLPLASRMGLLSLASDGLMRLERDQQDRPFVRLDRIDLETLVDLLDYAASERPSSRTGISPEGRAWFSGRLGLQPQRLVRCIDAAGFVGYASLRNEAWGLLAETLSF